MIVYLIKLSVCLSIILMVYHLFLEREKMHYFKRYFLLIGLIFSFLAPLVPIGELPTTIAENVVWSSLEKDDLINSAKSESDSVPIFLQESTLIAIYLSVSFFLLVRLLAGMGVLLRKIFTNSCVVYKNAHLVLVGENIIPHTFLSYIFVHAELYRSGKIESELFIHEHTHASEKHSLDVLFVELLQVVFWIVPLLLWYKKAIQLNHEFLADEGVLVSHSNVSQYQYLLLEKSGVNSKNYLASNLNYLITKKRLKMTTKSTPSWKTYVYASSCIPFFIGLLMLFGTKVSGQNEWQSSSSQEMKDAYFKEATFMYTDADGQKIVKKYNIMTVEECAAIPSPPPPPPVMSEDEIPKYIKPLPEGTIVHVNKKGEVWIEGFGGNIPPPPPPIKAEEHIKALIDKGAVFMLNGEEITGRKVLKLVSKDNYNLESTSKSGKKVITLKKVQQ